MALRAVLCVILTAATASAQWKRYGTSLMGGWATDSPPAHDLSYFRSDPCSRTDTKARVSWCCQFGSLERKERPEAHTNLRIVGKIGVFTIYDLEYLGDDESAPFMRSVLVQTAPGQFHEIHLQEVMSLGTLYPSEMVSAGRQAILAVRSYDGNMFHILDENYFSILPSGPVLLDFAPVLEAAERVLPADKKIFPRPQYDFGSLVMRVETERRDASAQAEGCSGHIIVPFRVEQQRVISGTATYFPQ
jgi:hypothetical protein